MGKRDKYEAVVNKRKSTSLKFDIYKPIIFVNSFDIITIAKLEAFCDKLDAGRYILSYSKIVTIELKNNKKLLNFFMTNKKIQKLIIKASGYRVLTI